MSWRRSQIVAVQTVVVVTLTVVVFLTLLQPEAQNPLFAVNASGQGGVTSGVSAASEVRNSDDGDRRGARDSGAGDRDMGSDGQGGVADGGVADGTIADGGVADGTIAAGSIAHGGVETGGVATADATGTAPPGTDSTAAGAGNLDDDSPAADQYEDTLALITADIN